MASRGEDSIIREVRTLPQEMLFALRSSREKECFTNSREVHSGEVGGGEGNGQLVQRP